ncbi:hypothetical protein CHISP_2809 [Chitinispirillum alkaliphilum]|nr:hypothetical protein CHISP_2809 [Chitinispirillum alkaliphilum]
MSGGSSINLLLGTSGWTYEHWKERFYPKELSKQKWFGYYTHHFDTVELNASFYRIPTAKVTQGWFNRSPENFRFAVKFSRLITHVKKLKDCQRELDWFFSVFEPLKEKICIYLIQLPPNLKCDIDRLAGFLKTLPGDNSYALEFRNTSWYTDKTLELLKAHHVAFCIHDLPGFPSEKIITSENVYIRFHGHESLYGGDYPEEVLKNWAKWIFDIQKKRGKKVMGYFNNDINAYSVKNCLELKGMVRQLQ